MKQTLFITLLTLLFSAHSFAGATYTINSNNDWNTVVGNLSNCWGGCTFNIKPGVTFTIDANVTCASCVFNYGDMIITTGFTCQGCTFNTDTITDNSSATLSLQSGTSSTTTFTKSSFTATGSTAFSPTSSIAATNSVFNFSGSAYWFQNGGTSLSLTSSTINMSGTGYLKATVPVNLSGSTINLSGTNEFYNDGGALTLSSSGIYLTNKSWLYSDAGPINLENSSVLQAGNGSSPDSAYINTAGQTVNIYDQSSIKLAISTNYFTNNGSAVKYYTTTSSGSSTSVATASTNINCNTGAIHSFAYACTLQPNNIYGCATIGSSITTCTILALDAPSLSAALTGANSVALSWPAGQSDGAASFTIQRSQNGTQWDNIGTLYPQTYTDPSSQYTFTDASALNGKNNYRLEVTLQNGQTIYSNTVTINISGTTTTGFSVYPSPITGQTFYLKVPSVTPIIIKTYTITGQLLSTSSLKGQTQYQISLSASTPRNEYIVVQVIGEGQSKAFTLLNE